MGWVETEFAGPDRREFLMTMTTRDSWFGPFPDSNVEVHGVHILEDLAVEEGTLTGTQHGILHGPMGDVPPTGRSVRLEQLGLSPAPAA